MSRFTIIESAGLDGAAGKLGFVNVAGSEAHYLTRPIAGRHDGQRTPSPADAFVRGPTSGFPLSRRPDGGVYGDESFDCGQTTERRCQCRSGGSSGVCVGRL